MAGSRLQRAYRAAGWLDRPDVAALAESLAYEDAQVLCSLGARRFWRWFDAGWDHALAEELGR